MKLRNLPNYDFTRLESFQRKLSLTEEDRLEMNLILQDMINHFFETVDEAIEIAVTQKLVDAIEDMKQ